VNYRVLLTTSVVLAASATQAQFVNGDFETGDFSGWTLGLTSGGAQAFQSVVDFDIDGPGPLGVTKVGQFSAGRASGVTTGEHGVTLTQMLNLDSGVLYTFEFDWAATRTVTTSNAQGGIFALMVNGVEINRSAAGSTSSTVPHFGHHSGTFTPTSSGAHEVGVWILRPFTIPTPTAPTLFQSVDNFTVDPIPEPASLAALGLGTLALLRRRKK
jgi:hypothetical protein